MHSGRRISFRGVLLASAIALAVFAGKAQAQTYNFRVLHAFTEPRDDGDGPADHVQFDAAGNLYGTTSGGSAYGFGAIFKIANDGTESIIHSFGALADGYSPVDGLTINLATGDLYGVTYYGGDMSNRCSQAEGCGVLYKLAADGTYTVLHRFNDRDGATPYSRPILDQEGNLYGTTYSSTIYKYSASGTLSVLYRFRDGSIPLSVIRDTDGNLYGATYDGGPNYEGTMFELSPDGVYTTLYLFGDGVVGGHPTGDLTLDKAGNLYGASGSSVYKLAPDGTMRVLYTFDDFADGLFPNGGLLLIGGNLYGTTAGGGFDIRDCSYDTSYDGCGTVFKLAPDGTKTILHTFVPRESIGPAGSLTYKYGRLYGTNGTNFRNGSPSGGTVYSIGVAK